MGQSLSLEKSLQAYRVLAAPAKLSWKQHYADEEFSSPDRLLCDDYERNQFANRLRECPVTICDTITAREGRACTLEDLVQLLNDPSNKGIAKAHRKVIYSTSNGVRPIGKKAFELWNGFQVIDMDIKDAAMASKLKQHIFKSLYKCNWFLGVTLSASGQGIHVYTKIAVPEEDNVEKRKLLYLTNFRHKYSFVYIVCKGAMEELEFTKEDLLKWMDLSMFKPQQGAFIGYDEHPLINTHFFEDFIYICFDNVEEIGHPEVDWVTYPDLREVFRRWEWFEDNEGDQPEVNVVDSSDENLNIINKVHYKHHERWKLANTLVRLYGLSKGSKYLRAICSNAVPDKELQADCITAARHNKDIDVWAVNRLNSMHGFKIKLDIQDQGIDESDLMTAMDRADNPNSIVKSKYYYEFHINRHQYLGHILDDIISRVGRITLIEAGPGLGKTEMVKQLVAQGKKVMMIMPFTSTIKSKVEEQEGWYYSYGTRAPKLGVEHGLALTIDKFSRLNMMDIKAAGFDYIFLDESHLLFMSEYRPVMPKVIDMIRNTEVPIILMSGTPTGELVFFQDIVHIHVIKEETRRKELRIHMVNDTSTLMYHMCRAMAKDIAAGRRILFPSNEGTMFSRRVEAGITYFLQQEHAIFEPIVFHYYKRSQVGEKFMDEVNFNKTIKDTNVLMCTTYLSVGVDILDKYNFSIYFGDLCTAAECDQWCNRLRNNDLYVKLYVAKNDADGNPRFINRFKPMNFKLDEEELKDMHSILRICNGALERNPVSSKYNSLVASIVHNNSYVVYNPIDCKYYIDEIAYKVVMFERKYRDYAQQLPVFMKGMQAYGYEVSACDLGEFQVQGAEIFKDLKNMVKMANDEQIQLNTKHIEELLQLMSSDRLDIYKDVLGGKLSVVQGREWKEDILNGVVTVKNAEVFEKVVPIFLSLTKMFDVSDVKDIFEYCRRSSGAFNFAALNRFRALVNIIDAQKNDRLDLPIEEFMNRAYEFSDKEKCNKSELQHFLVNYATEYAQKESTVQIIIENAQLTMKRLVDAFTKLFKCLVKCSRPDKEGNLTMERVEILWQTREEKSKDPSKNVYILSDFLDAMVEIERRDQSLLNQEETQK
jgi:hypothetical protein